MKPSTLALSFFGFCLFYMYNADWMDRLYETLVQEYLGPDYEEIAPFVPSVTAGAEEFDQIIAELAKSKRKWYESSLLLSYLAVILTFVTLLYQIFVLSKGRGILEGSRQFLSYFCHSVNSLKRAGDQVRKVPDEFSEGFSAAQEEDGVPVKLLWKGGSLVESSIHCNVRDDSVTSKTMHVQKQLVQSKLLVKRSDMGGGDETAVNSLQLSRAPSDESTAVKMAEIRRLLESEPEIMKSFEEREERKNGRTKAASCLTSSRRGHSRKAQKTILDQDIAEEEVDAERGKTDDDVQGKRADWEMSPDPKIMNRIRLLESRLRLEELKNKNWINRMSRAEGILQQLNKQVERIEETRPLETRTETLKITSTVTNWASSVYPRRNTQFTLVNQYQPFYLETPCLSLSEVIKKEIGLSSAEESNSGVLYPLTPTPTPTPPIPALSSSSTMPQSSLLGKFLSR